MEKRKTHWQMSWKLLSVSSLLVEVETRELRLSWPICSLCSSGVASSDWNWRHEHMVRVQMRSTEARAKRI